MSDQRQTMRNAALEQIMSLLPIKRNTVAWALYWLRDGAPDEHLHPTYIQEHFLITEALAAFRNAYDKADDETKDAVISRVEEIVITQQHLHSV